MKPIALIVACDKENGIGKEGTLPWHLPRDMAHFKDKTTQTKSSQLRNAVIMGRKTWDSIPASFKPLKDRMNIIVSRQDTLSLPKGVHHAKSLADGLDIMETDPTIETGFIIGGKQLYEQALQQDICETIYITKIQHRFNCDVHIPEIDTQKYKPTYFSNIYVNNDISYYFRQYIRR